MTARGALLLIVLAVFSPESAACAIPTVPPGFEITRIASIPGARELAIAPNDDLFVGTNGTSIEVVPHAEGRPQSPRTFVSIDDAPVAAVTVLDSSVFAAGQFGVYRIAYASGDLRARAAPVKIASVRTSGISRDHVTTSLAAGRDVLYVSVGSSCDSCDPELDATRATITQMNFDGSARQTRAIRIRNAIALAVNPASGTLWAGVAGQDELGAGHPFEIFDAIAAHAGKPDYGWPYYYENRRSVDGHDCSHVAVPRVVFPAYETPIGAVIYLPRAGARHIFPRAYSGGAFVTLHGSWHRPLVAPRVVFVPLRGDVPRRPVNWNDPRTQWSEFVGGYQLADGRRIGRPTGIAVGTLGDLFVSDDLSGAIYRIRALK